MKVQVKIHCATCGADLTPDAAQQNVLADQEGTIYFDRCRPWSLVFLPKTPCCDGTVRVLVNLGPETVDL